MEPKEYKDKNFEADPQMKNIFFDNYMDKIRNILIHTRYKNETIQKPD